MQLCINFSHAVVFFLFRNLTGPAHDLMHYSVTRLSFNTKSNSVSDALRTQKTKDKVH